MDGDYWVLLPWSGPAITRELLTHDLLEAHCWNLGQFDLRRETRRTDRSGYPEVCSSITLASQQHQDVILGDVEQRRNSPSGPALIVAGEVALGDPYRGGSIDQEVAKM